jgi:hypothetical protein
MKDDFTAMVHPGWRHWQDTYIHAGWRVQQHAVNGRCRVVDDRGRKYPCATEDAGLAMIAARRAAGLKPRSDHMILIVPGLNNYAFNQMLMKRRFERAGYECMIWDYASNRGTVTDHACRLDNALARLDGVRTVSFVTHSLGGLVLRAVLAGGTAWPAQLGRIVMIAPPHGGSFMADMVAGRAPLKGLYEWVCGQVGHELTAQGAAKLPPVTAPVGIITGGIYHNDGWVAWESSLIPAAADTVHIGGWPHTLMLWHDATARESLNFLRHGRFGGTPPAATPAAP